MEFGIVEKTLLPSLLAIVMLGMGLGLRLSDFRRILQTPAQVLVGSFGHFVLMPIAAFIVVMVMGLGYELALGIIIISACPSGTTSNLVNYLAKGDVALAVIITTLSTLLCPLLTPVVVSLLGGMLDAPPGQAQMQISFLAMLKTVATIIGIPIAIGMILRSQLPNFALRIEKPYKWFSILFLLFVIVFIVYRNGATMLDVLPQIGAAVVMLNTLAFILGYYAPRLLGMDVIASRTISIEVAIQNTTLGMALAVQFFSPLVALPAAIFSIWMYVAGLGVATYWSRNPPKQTT